MTSGPAHGNLVLNPGGSLSYTAKSGFTGTDTFTYVATDSAIDFRPVTVSITVLAPNCRSQSRYPLLDHKLAQRPHMASTPSTSPLHHPVIGSAGYRGTLSITTECSPSRLTCPGPNWLTLPSLSTTA
ncbi:Ig-like domain-containing protein [Xanthomonas campestris]|uniref:Ig-like domain-containing protein n=1 Tax=Xanthomonas campestris TaxID=339 RepID=UPI001CD71516